MLANPEGTVAQISQGATNFVHRFQNHSSLWGGAPARASLQALAARPELLLLYAALLVASIETVFWY